MTSIAIFWGIAAVFIVVALAWVLPPLFRRKPVAVKVGRRNINIAVYRDQLRELEADREDDLLTDEQFEAAKIELEARLAQDAVDSVDTQPVAKGSSRLGTVLAILIPIAAVGFYLIIGNPAAMEGRATAKHAITQQQIQAMLQSAEAAVKSNPDDIKTWQILARTYSYMNDWPSAVRAYKNLARLLPNDAAVWSHYGEALALANNRVLDGKPMEMVKKALKLNPKDIKALELSGIHAFVNHDYKAAVKYWQQLVKLAPAGTQYTQEIQTELDKARRLAGEGSSGAGLDNLSNSANRHAATGKMLAGTVSLAPRLKAKVSAGEALFIYARAAKPGSPPLAVVRLNAGKLPTRFELDDSQAMGPGDLLSNHKRVTLIARISKTGDAEPKPGDLEGMLKSVKVGDHHVKLVIDTVRN